MKDTSIEILNLLEEIVDRYNLEENLIENDSRLKEKLSLAKTPEEKRVFKFLYSKKINEYIKLKKPLEEISTSIALKKIIKKLINKKISFEESEKEIKKTLPNQKIAEEVSKHIINHPLIITLRLKEESEEENESANNIKKDLSADKKGLSQELI